MHQTINYQLCCYLFVLDRRAQLIVPLCTIEFPQCVYLAAINSRVSFSFSTVFRINSLASFPLINNDRWSIDASERKCKTISRPFSSWENFFSPRSDSLTSLIIKSWTGRCFIELTKRYISYSN